MNYMSEVAKMLGVELGEYFEINKHDGVFMLCYDGLFHTQAGVMCHELLSGLLSSKYTIKRKPWRPNLDDEYYYVDELGHACSDPWVNSALDIILYRAGNCYKTEEDAEKDKDKWVEFYKSDEVLEV